MLSQLTIKNIGLIDQITVDFTPRLNILTGETGAGKSILIDALRFTLGARMSSSHIRDEKIPCLLEAIFEISENLKTRSELVSNYLCDEKEIIISRTVLTDGRNRIKVNGQTVTLNQLKELGDELIDFNGPGDHHRLFSPSSHIEILDRLSAFGAIKNKYQEKFIEYTGLLTEQKKIKELAQSRNRELDTLAYQIKELTRVPLDEESYTEFIQEHTRLNNAEKIYEQINALTAYFENEETGINTQVYHCFTPLKNLCSLDETTKDLYQAIITLQENTSDILDKLTNYRENISFNPQKATELNSRYDIYCDIQRKYGPTIEDARIFYEQAKEKYEILIDLEHNDNELTKKIEQITQDLKSLSTEMTKIRKESALRLKTTIEKELAELGIKQVLFECRIETAELTQTGTDSVTFYISPNAGEDLKPLAEIVSSGEAARVMLALKKALIDVDPVEVLIFDEIDAQIGGRLGTVTGKKLKELSFNRQVILITHLPQIASFADSHFKISKRVENGRTLTFIEVLDKQTRIEELAKMMSGEKKNTISIKHAQDMLSEAK